jgi:hypothetical protein
MTATFALTLDTAKDRMRAALGDRDVPENALRQDEEFYAQLAISGDEAVATAVMAEGLAAEYAQSPDSFSESGGISVRWSERVKTWLALAAGIRTGLAAEAAASGAVSAQMVRVPDGGWQSEYVRGCLPGCGRAWYTD